MHARLLHPRLSTLRRTAQARKDFPEYKLTQLTPEQVRASAQHRIDEAAKAPREAPPRAPLKDAATGKERDEWKAQQRYSQSQLGKEPGTHDQFVSLSGVMTFERPHVHVVHDESNNEVRMHVTTASGKHSQQIALVGASGNEVNAAVDMLLAQLQARGR